MLKKSQTLIVLLIFLGSTFCTSEKFVDTTSTPKHYFAVIMILVILLFIAMMKKRMCIGMFSIKKMLWGINIICFIQACYGISQFIGWLQPMNSNFEVTGSFGNPAGFAAVLAMGFPTGLYLFIKAKKIERYAVVIGLVVIAMAVFLSGSRTGVLAILISTLLFLLFQTSITGKFQKLKHYKLLIALSLTLISIGSFALYYQKKDSANGRFLIWKVSSEMIKDKPVLGQGYGAFQAKYMDYQAEYFKNNSDSKYAQLADNAKHPFNEFIKVAVEFGIVVLIVVLTLFLFVLWKVIKSENENRGLVFSGLVSFLVFACFSYPLLYIPVWLILAFYLLALLPSKEIRIENTTVSIIARIIVVGACIFFLSHFTKQIQAEIKWKTIAMRSLRGNTEKMLPEYEKLYLTSLKRNSFFLYNYGAELNVANQYDKSIEILTECKNQFNDYDLQMLLADNYHKKGETEKAIKIYEHASNMVPCRFLPLYNLFEIYKETSQKDMAEMFAIEIINKKVKIPSNSVFYIQNEAKTFLNDSKL
ncbi:O-antigen ligase family protein [Mangrovibacterium sp.]|uniref:O-antigen ligase family protein n=1 Tax=Mangrovibacterium sp. TaxID=1961364 RepID=UPI00356338D4